MVQPLPTTIEGGCEGCGGWKWDNELVIGVVWKEAPESTTQSVGEGVVKARYAWKETREVLLQSHWEGREITRSRSPGTQGGNHSTGKDKYPRRVAARLRVELDAVTKDRIHGLIKGHENAPDKLAVVKGDTH
jgi:hypothetical protein